MAVVAQASSALGYQKLRDAQLPNEDTPPERGFESGGGLEPATFG